MSDAKERIMRRVAGRVLIAMATAAVAVLALLFFLCALPTSASPGPDVIVESITLDPPIPDAGQQFTLTIMTRNQGDAGTLNFWDHIYLDPDDDPPDESTPYTRRENNWPMGPGNPYLIERSVPSYSFAITGCDHVIYVWADATNLVAEDLETNNVLSQTVCVGVECDADAYEEDDTCATAGWLTEGVTQTHTLCPEGDEGDEDWVKFTAIGGVTYTIEAANLGAHADPLLYLYETCGGLYQFGTGPLIEWQAPASGVYYVQVEHRQQTHGPLANYDLVLSAGGGPGDLYEPDDTCAMARDIPTDGSRQTHLFQAAGDQDWVKFAVNSGETFAIIADNTGSGVNPLISLYSSCGQALSNYVNQSGQLTTTAPAGQTYYAQVVNQDSETYGPGAHYDLSVMVIPCVADGFEDDDSAAAASEILTTGETQTHNVCPTGDQDWVHFTAVSGTIYVLQTSNLGIAADTHLHLYDTDGQTELAHNDDYGYLLASRIIWQAPTDGTYYARVHHHNPNAAGGGTQYDLSITKGRCKPDDYEPDNGSFDAQLLVTDGQTQTHSFCADAILSDVSDQDWVSFAAVGGELYVIQTSDLAADSDTLLKLYDRDRLTLLAYNDDCGSGGASVISATLPTAGTYYVQVIHYNSTHFGSETDYQVSVSGEIAPTPTPTPPPTPPPTPEPPAPQATEIKTLIAVNRERVSSLYSAGDADALMSKLQELADHSSVEGAVIQVENDAAVAAAYSAWTADLLNLLDTDKANAVAGAVRNLLITFLNNNANVEYIVIVGDDRVIPYRRVPEGSLSKTESQYATSVTTNTTQWAACQDDMILTDDYYADEVPTDWQGHELYIPDYAIGRLIETPDEIMAFIDAFLADDVIETDNALVTGYDFVQDCGDIVSTLFGYDTIATDDALVGYSWQGADFRTRQLEASPRFDVQSINGHANHTTEMTPDDDNVTAGQVSTATSDLSGAVIFSVGCHAGFNDSGTLDLAQAFAQKKANYVANTGYGWGGSAVVYSEYLMKNYARELLRGTSTQIGPALTAAKQLYYENARSIGPYDVKILMQSTLYGLPMYKITSGGTLEPEDPFPSANITSTAPSAFGSVNVGQLDYGLAGAFGESSTEDGTFMAMDGWTHFSAGEPIQPRFFADASAPEAGSLHGAVFLGGIYSDTQAFDPVIALPYNEYVTSTKEPEFSTSGWYPAVPFQVRTSASVSTTAETMVTLLGQYNSGAGTERLYDNMSFGTYYSSSSDTEPAEITHLDGVLDETSGSGLIKIEATDDSDIIRVVVAYTDGQGQWHSQDLSYGDAMHKWTGVISGTVETRYFVQVVDGAGNVAMDDNKGQYHPFSLPLPLVEGTGNTLYLPLILKGG